MNFEISRNRLMELAKDKVDWLLLLDDDMGLSFDVQPEKIKELLNLADVGDRKIMGQPGGSTPRMTCGILRGDQAIVERFCDTFELAKVDRSEIVGLR